MRIAFHQPGRYRVDHSGNVESDLGASTEQSLELENDHFSTVGRERMSSVLRARCRMTVLAVVGGVMYFSGPLSAVAQEVLSLKRMSLEELMDIEVTSVSRRPEKLSGVASAVQVITQDDIRRSGATSLPEALRLASNLHVAQIDARQWAISARGFNSPTANKLLVLIDGRTVYTPLYAGVFWDVQDTLLEDIERIEVISGPGATLWGANAVNGVINITTKSARLTQGMLLTAAAGSDVEALGGARFGGTLPNGLGYRFYGKYADRDGPVVPDGRDISKDWRMGQGGFRVDGDISTNDALTVQADFYEGSIQQPTAGNIELSGANLLGRWSRVLAEGSEQRLQVYFDRTHRDIPRSFKQNLDIYDIDFQSHTQVGKRQEIVWGMGYRLIDDDIDNGLAFGFLPPDVTREWFSAFVEDEIAIGAAVRLTLGTKLEYNEYTDLEFQPSIRLSWHLDRKSLLWSAVSRAVRTPSRIDREFYSPSSPPFFGFRGGPDFDSEKLIAYEAGYRTQPHQKVLLSLSTFYNDYDDLRSVERINPPAAFPAYIGNGLKGETYGAEFTADYEVTNVWQLSAGYTELRVDLRQNAGSTDANPGSSESNDPERYFLIRSSLDVGADWQVDATYRQVSRIARQNVPSYDEVDLRIAWLPTPTLEISLVGRNLLNDHHPEFGSITPIFSSTRNEIERSAYGKIAWRLR
jgi:iron complex outermembrane receptor protein